jgi:hypothetical protein
MAQSGSGSANGLANETGRDGGDAAEDQRLSPDLCPVSETGGHTGDMEDAHRMAHNPEVAGSNPAPRH